MYYYGRKTVNDWMNNWQRPKQPNRKNLYWLREVNQCDREISRNLIVLYFIITQLGVDLHGLMASEKRQRTLLHALRAELKKYGVEEKWEKIFSYDISSIHRRREYVFLIIKENLRLTKHYPYFDKIGFDRLMDFTVDYGKNAEEKTNTLKADIEQWEAEHADEIAEYVKSIAEEKANLEKHREQIASTTKAEKEARRMARRMENAEVKEIRENERKYRSRQKKIDRSFERYWT